MVYDAANGTVVLFGSTSHRPDQTWTWDGSTWTRQSPATSPPAQAGASMAYDAATRTVVLFGGNNAHGYLHGTWTWDGSTWTRQSPATSPPARSDATMAYDAATGTVVLFGGYKYDRRLHTLGDTWTWDGSTWTRQSPATSPGARWAASMDYDAATGTVILFGGDHHLPIRHSLADTWAWDGSTWTEQSPATSPPARSGASMAYDAATGTMVLFGGETMPGNDNSADTWTWDGSTWTEQSPATSPPARSGAPMAYDAATGTVVLFGGVGGPPGPPVWLRGTWTWSAS
jgi:hypothetical protein